MGRGGSSQGFYRIGSKFIATSLYHLSAIICSLTSNVSIYRESSPDPSLP